MARRSQRNSEATQLEQRALELHGRAAEGDHAARTECLNVIAELCHQLSSDPDAAQEGALIAGERLAHFQAGSSLSKWLGRIVWFRHARPRRRLEQRTRSLDEEPADNRLAPELEALASDERRWLRKAVAKLSPRFRMLFHLYLEGQSLPEIATRLDVPPHTVRSRFARGLAALRARPEVQRAIRDESERN